MGYEAISDPRDRGCCSVNFLKYVFVIFNVLFILSGVVLCTSGLWTYYTHFFYLSLMATPTYSLITWLLVATGAVVMVAGILGCAGVHMESKFIVVMYSFLIFLVFMLEVVLGMLSYVYYEQIGSDLRRNLPVVFKESYSVDRERTEAIDDLQQRLRCCGGLSFSDWRTSIWYTTASGLNRVPDSCCKDMEEQCGRRDHPSNIPYTGCVHPMEQILRSRLIILGALGLSCAAFQLLGLLYSLALLCRLRTLDKDLRKEENERKNRHRQSGFNNGYHPVLSSGSTTS